MKQDQHGDLVSPWRHQTRGREDNAHQVIDQHARQPTSRGRGSTQKGGALKRSSLDDNRKETRKLERKDGSSPQSWSSCSRRPYYNARRGSCCTTVDSTTLEYTENAATPCEQEANIPTTFCTARVFCSHTKHAWNSCNYREHNMHIRAHH